MKEFLNRLTRMINRNLHKLGFSVITVFNKFYALIIGVKIGTNVHFKGWTSFFRETSSIIQIGEGCVFNSSEYSTHIGLNHRCIITTMRKSASISIGNNSGISSSTITAWESVEIGENVRIGANCVIMDGDFHLDDPRVGRPRKIMIADNVWLGAGVVVLKGVSIGENTIIGCGSIVTKDVPPNCIAAGNPCRVIKNLTIRQ